MLYMYVKYIFLSSFRYFVKSGSTLISGAVAPPLWPFEHSRRVQELQISPRAKNKFGLVRFSDSEIETGREMQPAMCLAGLIMRPGRASSSWRKRRRRLFIGRRRAPVKYDDGPGVGWDRCEKSELKNEASKIMGNPWDFMVCLCQVDSVMRA